MFSQQELAHRAGVSLFTIQRIERGEGSVRPSTGRAVAAALGVRVEELLPKVPAPPSSEPTLFNGMLVEARRTVEQDAAAAWKDYVSLRIDWCGRVVERTAEDEWNNPFVSLDSAIQWALCIGMEAVNLSNIVNQKVIPSVGTAEAAQELQRLVERFAALSDRTDERVNAMIQAAELDEEEKERAKLRLIDGGKKSA
jgi:transcriptional regulator with XRE-family HTH domain